MAKKGIRKLTLSWDLVYKISRCDKNMGQRALMILNHKTTSKHVWKGIE